MEYTVKALADLAGVTPRTLRWYDRIGLLKPLRTTEAGYRLYGPAQLDRLQDILFYRELYNADPISVDEMWAWLEKYAAIFKDYICDVGQYLAEIGRAHV